MAEVALKLFLDRGLGATSVEAIATEAGVGVRTVYDHFGSKAAILQGVLESFANVPRPEFEEELGRRSNDPRAQLRFLVDFAVRYFEAAEPFLDLIRRNSGAEPALEAAAQEGERLRRVSQRRAVNSWARSGALRPGLDRSAAADVLWAMTSPAVYLLFVRERGWSRRRYAAWLTASLEELLLSPRLA